MEYIRYAIFGIAIIFWIVRTLNRNKSKDAQKTRTAPTNYDTAPQQQRKSSLDELLEQVVQEQKRRDSSTTQSYDYEQEKTQYQLETNKLQKDQLKRKKLDRSIKSVENDEEFERSAAYKIKKSENELTEQVRNLLSDPQGVKQALIASEIFQRKY